MKKQNKAVSLIELSIVVLVIGILIAGVIQGSRMLVDSRLKSARALTRSSPVAGIKDLALWLETTSAESFLSSQAENGTQLTLWNDINPQVRNPFFARWGSSSGLFGWCCFWSISSFNFIVIRSCYASSNSK